MTSDTQLAVRGNDSIALQVFGQERLDIIKEQIGRGWKTPMTDAELAHIATVCERTRLDPLAKPPQIYFIKRYDSKLQREVMTPQVGIDGLRLIAARSREYLGQVGPQWCGADGVWKDVWLSDDYPKAARTGVLRRGFKEPIWSVALWSEWAQYQDEWKNGQRTGNQVLAPFWAAKPAHMLAKTSEGMSIKRAIPAETNELELAHLEELQRLEAPALAARYTEIYGSEEDGSAFAELPMGKGAPAYAVETPQGVVEHDGRVVDRESGEVLQDKAPDPEPEPETPAPPPPTPARVTKDMRRGETLELYGALLTQARQAGLIAEADMPKWSLRENMPEVQIISKGRELRALLNQATMTRATAAGPQPPDPSPEPEPQPEPSTQPEKPEMITTKSPLGQKLAQVVEEAARVEVDFTDAQIEFPAAKELVIRVIERLEDRIAQKAGGLEQLPEF